MDVLSIKVANVKCQGCVANIKNGLGGTLGVDAVDVDVATGEVDIKGVGLDRQQIASKLAELGYPETEA